MTTIPFMVMIISGGLWLVAVAMNRPDSWIRGWLIEVCRILFAVSAFWVVAGTVNRSVF